MTALDSLLATVSPRRTDPMHDICWRTGCDQVGNDRLGLCREHFEELHDAPPS